MESSRLLHKHSVFRIILSIFSNAVIKDAHFSHQVCYGTGPCSDWEATLNGKVTGSQGRFSLGNYGLATLLEIAQLKEESLVCTADVE